MRIISVITFSLSIAIAVIWKKIKYILQDFASLGFLTLLWYRWTVKKELFRQYKNGIVTFDLYNYFTNNFAATLRRARNDNLQRKVTECSMNSRDTWNSLNGLIRCNSQIVNHNLSSVSDPSVIAEVFKNYFSNAVTNLVSNILIQISPHLSY